MSKGKVSNLDLMQCLSDFQDKMDTNEDSLKIFFQNNENFNWLNQTKSKMYLVDETHKYFFEDVSGNKTKINDELAWSATNYMKNYDSKFNYSTLDIPEHVLKKAAADGTRIHKEIELKENLEYESSLSRIFNISVNNFREVIIWDPKSKVVGMIDLLDFSINDDELVIKMIDHKVSKRDKREYLTYQLNIYALAMNQLIMFLSNKLNLKVTLELYGNQIDKYNNIFKKVEISHMHEDEVFSLLRQARENYKDE